MKWRSALSHTLKAIDAEYERRIRAASSISEYRTYDTPKSSLDDIHMETEANIKPDSPMSHGIIQRFAPFKYIILLLTIYLILFFLNYVILSIHLPDKVKAFQIAYSIGTDGDPTTAYDTVKSIPLLWEWLLVFHVLAWLALPVITAAAVDVVFRLADERRRRSEIRIRKELNDLAASLHISPDTIETLIEEEFNVDLTDN